MSFFLHEPLGARPSSRLRAGIIADGTTRGGPNGLAQGARRVVEHAERCAERGDIELLAVFILSPKNLLRRKRPFFAALHAEFLRLLEGVASGRLLRGIRVEVHGRLDRLRDRGGAAAALADVVELLEETTRTLPEPRMTLALGVDYDERSPVTLGLDLLVRTGMEEPGVLRLSGLRTRPHTVCIPPVKLWRDFSPADLDDMLGAVPRAPAIDVAPGFSWGFVEGLVAALARARLGSPVQITVPIAAEYEETAAMLATAERGAQVASNSVAVILGREGRRARRRSGPRDAPVVVRLVPGDTGSPRPPADAIAWIAPGQPAPGLRLLERSVGDANVHTCDPTPGSVVDAVRRALRYHDEHPPLHGAPRAARPGGAGEEGRLEQLLRHVGESGAAPAEEIARALSGGREPEVSLVGHVFAARCVLDARAAGMMSGEVDWQRQAIGYGLTAFAVTFCPSAPDVRGRDWEPRARALGQVMLALGASDEEISDRVFEGEARGERRARLRTSIDYLTAALRGATPPVPAVPGAGALASIAQAWEGFFTQAARRADRRLLEGVRRSAAALYRANLAELSAGDGPLFPRLARAAAKRAGAALDEPWTAHAPEPVARRLEALLREIAAEPPRGTAAAWREIRLLCRLLHVAPSIGAGCAMLAVTATEPEDATPPGAIEPLLRTASLIDCYFRLVNDLAFTDVTRGDRDKKPNAFTCLVPSGLRGKPREQARMEALQTCLATAAWLNTEIERGLTSLWRTWPVAARWWQRGIHFGRRVYERGHYDRLTPGAAAEILSEVASLAAPPGSNAVQ